MTEDENISRIDLGISSRGAFGDTNLSRQISSSFDRLFEELRQLRKDVSIQPSIIRYRRVMKTVDISNIEGDARISFYFDCMNGQKRLERLRHRIEYDGEPLSEGSILVRVDSKSVSPEVEGFGLHEIPGGKKLPFDNLSIFYISPEVPIEKNTSFNYEYTVELKKVFRDLPEKEYSSHMIMHPTDALIFSIRSPAGYNFDKDHLDIQIVQYSGMSDDIEKDYINETFPPILMKEKTEIIWEIKDPKITYTYIVNFRAKKV